MPSCPPPSFFFQLPRNRLLPAFFLFASPSTRCHDEEPGPGAAAQRNLHRASHTRHWATIALWLCMRCACVFCSTSRTRMSRVFTSRRRTLRLVLCSRLDARGEMLTATLLTCASNICSNNLASLSLLSSNNSRCWTWRCSRQLFQRWVCVCEGGGRTRGRKGEGECACDCLPFCLLVFLTMSCDSA